MDNGSILIAAVLAGTHWFLVASNLQRARRVSGGTLFSGSLPIRLLLVTNCLVGIWGLSDLILSHHLRENWLAAAILPMLIVGSIHYWPEAILVTQTEISRSRFLGIGRKCYQ